MKGKFTIIVFVVLLITSAFVATAEIENSSFFQSKSVSADTTIPSSVEFNQDGTKLFVADNQDQNVIEYSLSVPYDISTLSRNGEFSVSGETSQIRAVTFADSGTTMYVGYDRYVYEYSLSTAYDISTASYIATSPNLYDTFDKNYAIQDLKWRNGHLFIIGNGYNILTKWDVSGDISTISYEQELSVQSETTSPTGFAFNNFGTKLFVEGGETVYEYDLSSDFDLSTGSYTANSFNLANSQTSNGLDFDDDGDYFYTADSGGEEIDQYSTSLSGFEPEYELSGYVENSNGSPIENATIADDSGNYTANTNQTGYYKISGISEGTYNFTVSKDGYGQEEKSIFIASDTQQNFTLSQQKIVLEVKNWMEFGSSQEYVVKLIEGEDTQDVTQNSTVISNNTSVITVDSGNSLLIATKNDNVSQRVNITAKYENYTVRENVTVAERTLENIDIMPPEQYISSFLGVGSTNHGIGSNVQWILFIIFIMSVTARMIENPWAGVGSGMLVSILIWVLGYIALNVVLSTTFFGILAGLVIVKTRKQGADVTVNQ